ncbi:Sensor protein ZraS [bacterium HR30]|nr:Sensor protein ZraS [bacterium HR30]
MQDEDSPQPSRGERNLSPERSFVVLEALPCPVLVADAGGKVLFANGAAVAVLGVPIEALRGRTAEEIWAAVGAQFSRNSRICGLFPGSVASVEWGSEGGERRFFVVSEAWLNLEGENAKVILLQEAGSVVAELSALGDCRDRFHTFMSYLPGVAYMKDPSGRYVYVSPTFERHFGRPADWYVGKLDTEVWPAEVAEQLRASDATVLRQRTVVQSTEQVPQSDGIHYWLATKFPILGPSGEVALIGGVAVDVTEERRALENLKELERATQQRGRLADVGAITAQILHDLANPIAGLSMQVQLLLRRAGRDPDRPVATIVQSLGRLLAEVQRLDVLLREFKEFAREQRLELQPLRLRTFLTECVNQWRPVARAREIALNAELAPDLPVIRADPEQLRRVMDNLLKNAIEAIDRGPGSIWVHSLLHEPEHVRISVLDDGPGIAPHVDPFRLFETTKPYGTGLGLPIVRQIVEAHGGKIQFEPREPRGVVFHVDLPQQGPAWPVPPGGFVRIG